MGYFIALGNTSKRAVSDDGKVWTTSSPGSMTTTPSGLAYARPWKTLAGGGTASWVDRSTDRGVLWTPDSGDPFTSSVRVVLYVEPWDLFLAGAEDGRIASSDDAGVLFFQREAAGAAVFWRGGDYSPTLDRVLFGAASFNRRSTTPDGITWTTVAHGWGINEVCWCSGFGAAGLFVIAGGNSASSPNLETSPDGFAPFTVRSLAAMGHRVWGMAYAPTIGPNGRCVVGGDLGGFAYSDDGVTWNAINAGFGTSTIFGIAWSPRLERFVAVGSQGTCAWSDDGIVWTHVGPLIGGNQFGPIVWADSGGGWRVGASQLLPV